MSRSKQTWFLGILLPLEMTLIDSLIRFILVSPSILQEKIRSVLCTHRAVVGIKQTINSSFKKYIGSSMQLEIELLLLCYHFYYYTQLIVLQLHCFLRRGSVSTFVYLLPSIVSGI